MSRYIDADALKANCDITVGNTTIGRRDYVMFHEIDSAPSIDIVRCKECRHWHREIGGNGVEYVNFSKCSKGHYGNGLDFHCADGERKESE